MKALELLRVTRLCLPQLLGNHLESDEIHDESELDVKTLCSLWSGMGHIYRIKIPHHRSAASFIIVKHVAPPPRRHHAVSFGDQRKADSYQVEANFYEKCAKELIAKGLNLPNPLWIERDAGPQKNEIVIAMTYVENQPIDLSEKEPLRLVLTWLATLHAMYWGVTDETVNRIGLQRVGTYWHLDTRPDEHQSMPNTGWQGRLKMAARAIDFRLKRDIYQCIVHGDAKDANILYSKTNQGDVTVCFCDFQYCGKGVPAKDLAYLFCSSVSAEDETAALEFYLQQLKCRLPEGSTIPSLQEMEELMDLAYCDYFRFMSGWGFWGSGCDIGRVKKVLDRLDGGKKLKTDQEYDNAVQREYG